MKAPYISVQNGDDYTLKYVRITLTGAYRRTLGFLSVTSF